MGTDSGAVTLMNYRYRVNGMLGPLTSWGILRAMSPSEAPVRGLLVFAARIRNREERQNSTNVKDCSVATEQPQLDCSVSSGEIPSKDRNIARMPSLKPLFASDTRKHPGQLRRANERPAGRRSQSAVIVCVRVVRRANEL